MVRGAWVVHIRVFGPTFLGQPPRPAARGPWRGGVGRFAATQHLTPFELPLLFAVLYGASICHRMRVSFAACTEAMLAIAGGGRLPSALTKNRKILARQR